MSADVFTHPVYRWWYGELLSRALLAVENLPEVLIGLHRLFSFFCESDIVLFFLKTHPRAELDIACAPGISQENFEYFFKFCKQDILQQDPYLDLESLDKRYLLGKPPRIGRRNSDGALISSYAGFALTDKNAQPFGSVHFGSLKNRYFNDRLTERLKRPVEAASLVLSLAVRTGNTARRHRSLRTLFAKFLPEPAIDQLTREGPAVHSDKGLRLETAVLFCDIRSFTSLAESNAAEAVVGFLNRHFQVMVALVEAGGGAVDRFIGDALVAVFGLDGMPGACERALAAARGMVGATPRVDRSGLEPATEGYSIGIGIHFGETVVGYLGSSEKIAYTALGKTVDTAESLESETKRFGVPILFSQAVAQRLPGGVASAVELGTVDQGGAQVPVFTVKEEVDP